MKTYNVFLRKVAKGDPLNDLNVISQHRETYMGIVRGDSRERAMENAQQKTGRSATELLVTQSTTGENSAFCPHCGFGIHTMKDQIAGVNTVARKLDDIRMATGDDNFQCPECGEIFKVKIETVIQTICYVPEE